MIINVPYHLVREFDVRGEAMVKELFSNIALMQELDSSEFTKNVRKGWIENGWGQDFVDWAMSIKLSQSTKITFVRVAEPVREKPIEKKKVKKEPGSFTTTTWLLMAFYVLILILCPPVGAVAVGLFVVFSILGRSSLKK